MKNITTFLISVLFLFLSSSLFAQVLFSDDFESGSANSDWGSFFKDEETVVGVSMSEAPVALPSGGNYVGYLQDSDGTYTGVSISTAGETSLQNYSIEADVYCYVNAPDASAYTGLAVYADSAIGTYIKMVADFDADQRIRLFNNHFSMATFSYSFDHTFSASDIPGGIPAESGWHKMKVEVQTVDETTTAFNCYFDGELLAGCPINDTGDDRMSSGEFGVFAFQQDADGIPGYFDNVVVKSLAVDKSFEDDFESGSASSEWGSFFKDEETVVGVSMSEAPVALPSGGNYVGYLQDSDGTYTGVSISTAGETSLQNYSIEADVYCYVNAPDASAYTGLAVYADSAIGTYIKMVADFDADQRIRLFNNHFSMATFSYSFDHTFSASDIPGGIPAESGWHKMKVEVQTVDETTTAFNCYFDGELLAGCPINDTGDDRMSSGEFGVFAFQQDADGIPGYFDNIVVGDIATGIREININSNSIPEGYALDQNYPNPFNPSTQLISQFQRVV